MPEEDVFLLFLYFFPILHSHIEGVWIYKGWHCSESFIAAQHIRVTCIGRIGASLPLHLDASLRHQHRKEEHPFRRTGKKAGGSIRSFFQLFFNHRSLFRSSFFFRFSFLVLFLCPKVVVKSDWCSFKTWCVCLCVCCSASVVSYQ